MNRFARLSVLSRLLAIESHIILSCIDGHLGCFHILVIVNNAAVTIGVHISFQTSVLSFFEYIPRHGISGS